jgi:hypothetical protein
MIVTPRETWKIGEKTYASGSVLAIDFKPFKMVIANSPLCLSQQTARLSRA